MSVEELIRGLKNGDRRALSRSITLIESTAEKDQDSSDYLLDHLSANAYDSHRMAITGVPGVGKSTFIERLGLRSIEKGRKVAVLAVDPSSKRSHGSILGDKTRMEQLSMQPSAFIRPSPAADTLGGVARKTQETILLCEAAGFNDIIIETVGVGQSEIEVKDMVDTFVLLMLAGAGDELQGIKRGIMEMADILVIHKAEEENLSSSKEAASDYRNALHLLGQQGSWTQRVELMSSITGFNEEAVWTAIEAHREHLIDSQELFQVRKGQQVRWFDRSLNEEILKHYFSNAERKLKAESLRSGLKNGELSARSALKQMFQ